MPEQLLDDLRTLGTLLERTSVTISLDDIAGDRSIGVEHGVDDGTGEPVRLVGGAAAHLTVVSDQAVRPARSAPGRVAAAILVAAALVGALWIVNTRPEQQQPTTNPPAGAVDPSATPDPITFFPLLDASDLPSGTVDGELNGTWSNSDLDQGWSAYYGVPADNGVPTSVILVTMLPPGSTLQTDTATAGREEGVSEIGMALQWMVDGTAFTIGGADPDLLYSVRPLIRPAVDGAGFELAGPLPAGLVELDPPRHQAAGWSPGVGSADDITSINLFVSDLSPYMLLTLLDVAAVTVEGRPGFIGSGQNQIDIALALSDVETIFITSSVLTRDELLAVAASIRFTDEPTWRDHYSISWGGDAGEVVTSVANEVVTASTVEILDTTIVPVNAEYSTTTSSVVEQPISTVQIDTALTTTLPPEIATSTTLPSADG